MNKKDIFYGIAEGILLFFAALGVAVMFSLVLLSVNTENGFQIEINVRAADAMIAERNRSDD